MILPSTPQPLGEPCGLEVPLLVGDLAGPQRAIWEAARETYAVLLQHELVVARQEKRGLDACHLAERALTLAETLWKHHLHRLLANALEAQPPKPPAKQ